MIRPLVRNLLIGALILTGLTFLFHKTRLLSVGQHDHYMNTLQKLIAVDVQLNENILKSRFRLLANYDPIIFDFKTMKIESAFLQTPPSFVKQDDLQELSAILESYNSALAEKDKLHERFKSQNAILHNSLSFFPQAASELAEKLIDRNLEVSVKLRDLVRLNLLYNLYSNEDYISPMREIIKSLKDATERLAPMDQNSLKRVVRHAETILENKRSLDDITKKLLTISTRQQLHRLYERYYNSYSQALAETNNYRLLLYCSTIVLITVIVYTFIHLHNTAHALSESNEFLDRRVQERTAELRDANLELTEQKSQLLLYVDELSDAHEKMHQISITDELTGLFSRRFLFEWLEKELSSVTRSTGEFSCLLCDIDHFKDINDTYGHPAGDRALKEVAAVLRNGVRSSDIVGRYGGEEFLVLLPNTGLEGAVNIAEKIRHEIEQSVKDPRPITMSLGVSTLRCDNSQALAREKSGAIDLVLERADNALYKAKESGRNCVKENDQVVLL